MPQCMNSCRYGNEISVNIPDHKKVRNQNIYICDSISKCYVLHDLLGDTGQKHKRIVLISVVSAGFVLLFLGLSCWYIKLKKREKKMGKLAYFPC